MGWSLIWDCTCVDTFAGVCLNMTAIETGKRRKYTAVAEAHQFETIAVKMVGVYGGSTEVILRTIGRRLVEATGEPRRLTASVKTCCSCSERQCVQYPLSR